MSTNRKALLTAEQKALIRKSVKLQLKAIHPKLQQPASKTKKKGIHQESAKLQPNWKEELTNRLFEKVMPHRRRGTKVYHKGTNDGLFLGSLIRDHQAAEVQAQLPGKHQYLCNLKEDIEACEAASKETMAALPAKDRRNYAHGFVRGMGLAEQRPMQGHESKVGQADETLILFSDPNYTVKLLTRLWNRMPAIATRCKSIPELFTWLHGQSAKDNLQFPAFQKLCQRLGIRLRPQGRPRKT